MTVKNAVSNAVSLQTSFDGLKYSAWPLGNKPTGYQTSPTVVDTDIISGSLTGGENNKGAYVRVYGYAFGKVANLGLSTGIRAFYRDPLGDNAWHEVDNYRYLKLAKVYPTHQLQEMCFQIGTLGGSQVTGRTLDFKVTVSGVDSNIMTGQFTIQPGRFAFIDNVNGNDATALFDNIAKPWRYAQKWAGTGSNFSNLWGGTTAQSERGLRAGDTIVLRGNAPWVDQTGYDNRFIRFRIHTGSVPTGTAGTGYIHITAYPGENVVYNDPSGGGGFLQGCNTAYGTPNDQATFTGSISGTTLTITNMTGIGSGAIAVGAILDPRVSGIQPGTVVLAQLTGSTGSTGTYQLSTSQTVASTTMYSMGWGQYVSVSGITATMNAASRGDAGGVNFQTSSNYWRVYGMELGPWPSNLVTPNNAKAGGIAGNGTGIKIKFNYVHDIACDINNPTTSANENHGVYLDGSNICSHNCEVAYNWVKNITGGSGIQCFNQVAADTTTNFNCHHNFVDTTRKYGLNPSQDTDSANFWNNIVINTVGNGFAFNTENNATINVSHNLFYNCVTQAIASPGTIDITSTPGVSSVLNIEHNIIVLGSNRAGSGTTGNSFYSTYSTPAGTITFNENLYYDPDGLVTSPGTSDAHAITANPLFSDVTTNNFTLMAGSPALGACTQAEVQAVLVDFYGIARPVTGTGAPGSTKNDIGPTQGIGT